MGGPIADRVVRGYGEPRLASIATCLLLQAAILGAGWLLRGVNSHQEPLQGDRSSLIQPELGAGRPLGLGPWRDPPRLSPPGA